MCAIAFRRRAAWQFSARLNAAAATADAAAPASPPARIRLSAPNCADHLAAAAAVAAGFAAQGLAFAVALRADVFAGARRAGLRFVARVGFRLVFLHANSPASSSLRARMRSP